jgi:hypothetical protein
MGLIYFNPLKKPKAGVDVRERKPHRLLGGSTSPDQPVMFCTADAWRGRRTSALFKIGAENKDLNIIILSLAVFHHYVVVNKKPNILIPELGTLNFSI